MAPAGKLSVQTQPPPQPPVAAESDAGLAALQASGEQEEAVSGALDYVVGQVLEVIRDRQSNFLAGDNAAALVIDDIRKIYSTVDIRYDLGDGSEQETTAKAGAKTFEVGEDETRPCAGDEALLVKRTNIDTMQSGGEDYRNSPVAETLRPGPEPEPSPIDRWARGCVVSRTTKSRDTDLDDRISDDASEGGKSARSIRSTRSFCTLVGSASRARALRSQKQREEQNEKPFPIGPEVREDQSLPPAPKRSGCKKRSGHKRDSSKARRRGGGKREVDSSSEGDDGSEVDGSAVGGGENNDSIANALKDLCGREWTIDGSGEVLILDRPKGDALPGTVVSASYAFRDGVGKKYPNKTNDQAQEGQSGRGGEANAARAHNSAGSNYSHGARETSSGGSRRRSSRRRMGRNNNEFFALEPTLQPNLTASLDRPGPGVSVCDGSSVKEGPHWPQDPNHMSRSDYRQRQRKTDGINSLHGNDEGETSTLGFSLGSVQSAPALVGQGISPRNDTGSGGRNNARGGTAEQGHANVRGDSFTVFDNVNPFEGGMRVEQTVSPPSRGARNASSGEGGSRRGRNQNGGLSPLSTSTTGNEEGKAAGPESVGDEDDSDPHLSLIKDPDWGRNTRGVARETGILPKVKQVSRERPLTHRRPHTHNPRDPRKVPARAQAHVSPKSIASTDSLQQRPQPAPWEGRQVNADDASSLGGSSSFPPLPMSLSGWGTGLGDSLVHAVTEEGEYSWDKCLAASEDKLLVIDCHQDWCGPCDTLQPTFNRISLETIGSEDRVMFLSANLEKFADRVQAHLPKDSGLDLTTHGCMPFTTLIKAGVAVATVRGCDAPAILREVNKHMPALQRGEKEAEPE